MLEKIETVSETKDPSSTYIAPLLQQSNEQIERKVEVFTNDCCFYHQGMSHIRSIIKTTKHIHSINHKTGEVTEHTSIQYCIANFREEAQFFHDRILDHWKVETMHQHKDVSLKEDDHQAHKNPLAMTIIRSMVINILQLYGVRSIHEQLVRNQWELKGAMAQLLKFSF